MATGGESEADTLNRFRDSFARGNAEFQKVTSLLISLATALIALPIFFFKEIFKENIRVGETIFTLINKQNALVASSIYAAWILILLSIASGIAFMFLSGRHLQDIYKYNYPPDYLDSTEGQKVAANMNSCFGACVSLFFCGFTLMMLFVLFYSKTTLDPAP